MRRSKINDKIERLDTFLEAVEKFTPIDDDPDRAEFLDALVPVTPAEEKVLSSFGFEDAGDEEEGIDHNHFYDKKVDSDYVSVSLRKSKINDKDFVYRIYTTEADEDDENTTSRESKSVPIAKGEDLAILKSFLNEKARY